MKRLILLSFALTLLLAACSEDNGTNPPITPQGPRGLYILNEGNFQRGNATLSFYMPDSNIVYNDLFQSVNGRPLGDVGNSITIHDGLAYLVINNSHRIEVIDVNTHKSVGTIASAAGASPRQIAFSSNGVGFVSNLFAGSVSVYEPARGKVVGEIPVGENPDGIAAAGNTIVVANSGFGSGNTVSIIDAVSRSVVKTLRVGDYPTAVYALGDIAVAVLCTGDYGDFNDPNDDTPGALYIIDTQTRLVADSLVLGGHPQRLERDRDGHLYTIHESGVTRIHLASKSVTRDFIPGFFYNIFIDTTDRRIYLTNPLDYVQAGKLEIFSLDGTHVRAVDVGIIPNAMVMTK
jgi:DNA-binding beta-propeller fold protein YncE